MRRLGKTVQSGSVLHVLHQHSSASVYSKPELQSQDVNMIKNYQEKQLI